MPGWDLGTGLGVRFLRALAWALWRAIRWLELDEPLLPGERRATRPDQYSAVSPLLLTGASLLFVVLGVVLYLHDRSAWLLPALSVGFFGCGFVVLVRMLVVRLRSRRWSF